MTGIVYARGIGPAMRTFIICALLISLGCVYVSYVEAATATAEPVSGRGASEAIAYIKARQNSDGGFSEPGEASDPLTTSWALLAGASVGEKPLTWANSGADPSQFLITQAGSIRNFKEIELIALAITKAGGDPRNAAGIDLVSLGKANIASDGKIGSDIAEHCWGTIFLAAAGETVPAKCTKWLVKQQRQDGGWGESDKVIVQDTGLGIEALIVAGGAKDKVDAAAKLLKGRINSDGGFKGSSGSSDAQTTAGVVRAIRAIGQDPSSNTWSFHGNNTLSFLSSLQAADGHFRYSNGVESQPTVTTAMVAEAVAGRQSTSDSSNSSSTTTNDGSSTTGNLGTAGADISKLDSSTNNSANGMQIKVGLLQGPSSGAEGSVNGAIGFWLFLIICAIYLGLLIALVAVVGILVRRNEPPSEPLADTRQYPRA